jgi:tetratricopeptide (TPR) repeat protein
MMIVKSVHALFVGFLLASSASYADTHLDGQLAAAQAALDHHDDDLAIRLYTDILGIASLPDDVLAFAHNCRGIAYNDERHYPQPLDDFDAAIRLRDDYAEAYNNKGIVHRAEGRLDAALEDYSAAKPERIARRGGVKRSL